MKIRRYTDLDPNIPVELLDCLPPEDICEDMVGFQDMYFSKDAYVSQMYLGVNGTFLLIPCKDSFSEDEQEQTRCAKVLQDIKDVLELSLYLYPVFVSNESAYYAPDAFRPVEVSEPFRFIHQLYLYTSQHKTRPDLVYNQVEAVWLQEEFPDEYETISVLDSKTLERVMVTVSELEGIDRPNEKVRYDEEGTEYVLRDSDVTIGKINTGLIGKKKWYRVSDINSWQVLFTAMAGGCFGLHKLITHEYGQSLIYLLTGGFGGILPAVDVFCIGMGSYRYSEAMYYQNNDGTYGKQKDTLYLRKVENKYKVIAFSVIALIVGLLYSHFIYSFVLEAVIKLIAELGTSAGGAMYQNGLI